MKRLLPIFLLLLLSILPMCSYAGDLYTDVEKNTLLSERLSVLTHLKIFSGISQNGQNYFYGDKTLTRAEAAKLIVHLSQSVDSARGLGNSVNYADVDATHWAADYIAYLSDLQVLNGMGDGTFAPEDALLSEQFVKMIVSLLGYAPQAQGTGGYPVGYLSVASQTKLLKDCPIVQGEPLTREKAAILCYNALDIPLMKQTLWSGTQNYVITGTHADYPEETLLTKYFDAEKLRGTITETYEQVPVNRDDLYILLKTQDGKTHKFDVQTTGAEAMLGQTVAVYTIKNTNNGEQELLTVVPDADNRTIVFSLADAEISINSKNRLQIKTADKTYTTATDARFYHNGDPSSATDILALAEKKGQITLLYHGTNSLTDYIFVETVSETLVVDAIDAQNNRFSFKNGTSRRWNEKDDTYYLTFIKNGQRVSLSSVVAGDTLSLVSNANQTSYRIYIASDILSGRVTAVSQQKVMLHDTAYPTAEGLTFAIGTEGYFYRDTWGDIIYYEKDMQMTANDNFGYLFSVAVEHQKLSSDVLLFGKLLDNDGFWNELPFAQKLTVVYGNSVHTAKDTQELLTNIRTWTGGLIRYVAAEKRCFISEGSVAVVQYELNDAGEIKKLLIPKTTAVTDAYLSGKTILGMEYEKDTQSLARLEVTDQTVIFTVKNGITEEIENISVGRMATILEKNTPYFGYGYVSENGDVGVYNALCLFTEEQTVMGDTPFVIVEETTTVENQEGEIVPAFWGYTDGKSDKRLFLLNEKAILTEETVTADGITTDNLSFAALEAGDTVAALYNESGEITHLCRLISKARVTADGIGFSYVGEDRLKEDMEIHFGYVAERKKDRENNNMYILSAYVTDDKDAVQEIARIREGKLNGDVYFVDVTHERVKIADAGDFDDVAPLNVDIREGKTHDDGYGYFIYAKLYENEIIGAVIYVVDCEDMM